MKPFSRCLVVEDLDEARQWLREILEETFPGIAIEEAATAEQAREHIVARRFPLAMIDLNLPDGVGHELVPQLIRRSPSTCAVITTVYDDDAHLFPALRAGAHGYLLKTDEPEVLMVQLRGIVEGRPPLSASVAQRILGYFALPADTAEPLTNREKEVLALIARGMRMADAAAELDVSLNTVATHVKHIYGKLNVNNRAQAGLAAERLGILDARVR